jgi:hypothetical protein
MRTAGRVNIVLVGAIVAIVMIGSVLFMGRQSINAVASKFMSSLATHDVNTLTDMTFLNGRNKEDVRKQWDFAVNDAGKHYIFVWRITSSKEADDKTASVSMQVVRNARSGTSYEEKFDLPLVKENGDWKVDVSAISRDLFPALPQ